MYNLDVSIYLWMGLMAGWWSAWLGERRQQPVFAGLVGGGIALVGGYLVALSYEDPVWGTEVLAPHGLAVTMSMIIVTFILDGVSGQVAQERAVAAELARTRAELHALRAQINPHFLFNSLNTIRYCIRTNPTRARRLLVDLSDVFQHALRAGEFVPLGDEIHYVEAYLALEKSRLDERLQVEWTLPPEEYLAARVPTLILQPIVENAVIHAIAKQTAGGTIQIILTAADDHLLFRVTDDGMGMEPGQVDALLRDEEPVVEDVGPVRSRPSIGLRNIHARLRALFGSGYGLEIASQLGAGTTVQFRTRLLDEPVREGFATV